MGDRIPKETLLARIAGMQHRRPDPACPLCPLWGVPYDPADPATHGAQHAAAQELWSAWDGSAYWPRQVVAVAAGWGVACTEEQARRHFAHHRIEQPLPPGRLNRRAALAEAATLSSRQKALVRTVARARLLSRSQLRELFYDRYPVRSTRASLSADLRRLIRSHFLYRFYPDPAWPKLPDGFLNEVFFLLGRQGVPFVERAHGYPLYQGQFTQFALEVGYLSFVHDWRANGCFVALKRALRARGGRLRLPSGETTLARLSEDNWYGARMLTMSLWSRRELREIRMRPDGFCSLALERAGFGADSLPSTQLPFFYEFDSGSKDAYAVAEQILNYHRLAQTDEAGRRFPDLAVPGYSVPMVMIFAGFRRVQTVGRAFRHLARKSGLRAGGAPIFLVEARAWERDPFADGLLELAWDETLGRFSLLEGLLEASSPLLQARALTARQTLRLDPYSRRRRSALAAAGQKPTRKRKASAAAPAGVPPAAPVARNARQQAPAAAAPERAAQGARPEEEAARGDVEAVIAKVAEVFASDEEIARRRRRPSGRR